MLPTVEVDASGDHAVAQACDAAVADVLLTAGRAKKSPKVTVYVYEGPSVNFGRPTNSTFFAVAGPERVLIATRASLGGIAGAHVRYGDYIPASSCEPRMHLEAGVLWVASGGGGWESLQR
jgi:hypothetical protein